MNPIKLEEYRAATDEAPFSEWLDGLRDTMARVRIAKRLTRLQAGLMGDCKGVGGGILELRDDHGPGYRAYCARDGSRLAILLAGGNRWIQSKHIERAQSYC